MLTYRKYFDTELKYFPIFISYTIFTELLGYFIKFYDDFQFFSDSKFSSLNIIIYNLYQLIAYLFFYWVYFKAIKSPHLKKYVKYGVAITLLVYLVNMISNNPLYKGLYYAELIGSWTLLMCIVFYFKEKRNEQSTYPMKNNLLFWVSISTFIFYAITPYMWLIGSFNDKVWFTYSFQKILFVLITLMYLLYTIGLILGSRGAFR